MLSLFDWSLDDKNMYTGSTDIDVAGIEQFVEFAKVPNTEARVQTSPFYFYNTITTRGKKYKARFSKMFAARFSTTSYPNGIITEAVEYKYVDNISSLTLRADMTQLPPGEQVRVVLKNLLSVDDSLTYVGYNKYRFTMRNVVAPFNFKYGFNKLFVPSVDKPSIILSPLTLQAPTSTYVINPPNTSRPSIVITLSPVLPTGIHGKNVMYSIQVLRETTDVTSSVSLSVSGNVFTYENMDSTSMYTFILTMRALTSLMTARISQWRTIGPVRLKSILVPSFTNTTFQSDNGVITIDSTVSSYEGIDNYILTIAGVSQTYPYTGSPIVIQNPSLVAPQLCTLQTQFNGVSSSPLSIIYVITGSSLQSIPNWWTSGAYYKVSASCDDLIHLNRDVVYFISISDVAENIILSYNERLFDVCYTRAGGANISSTDELGLTVAMFFDDKFTVLLTNRNFVLKDTSTKILAKIRLWTNPPITKIVITDPGFVFNVVTYLERVPATYTSTGVRVDAYYTISPWLTNFLKLLQYPVKVDTSTILLMPSAVKLALNDTADKIMGFNLTNYSTTRLISIMAPSVISYDWATFEISRLATYMSSVFIANVPLESVPVLQANANITMSVNDSASNYRSVMKYVSSKGIEKITISGLSMTYVEFLTSLSVSLLFRDFSVTGVTCLRLKSDSFLRSLSKAQITVEDSAVHISELLKSRYRIKYVYADGLLDLTYALYLNLGTGKIMTPFKVTNVPASLAYSLQNNSGITEFSVYDSPVNIESFIASFNNLETLLSHSKLTSITGTTSLSVKYFEGMTESSFKKITNCVSLSVPVSAIDTVNSWVTKNSKIMAILDDATIISANLAKILLSNADSIDVSDRRTSVTTTASIALANPAMFRNVWVAIVDLTDTTVSLDVFRLSGLSITSFQFGLINIPYADTMKTALMAKLQTAFVCFGVPCNAVSSLLSNTLCQSISVSDTATRIIGSLATLQSNVSRITSVSSTSGTINPTISQYISPNPLTPNVNTIYQKMVYSKPNTIACSSIQTYIASQQLFNLVDNSTTIVANLDKVKSAANLILSISSTSNLLLTYAQIVDNPALLSVLSSTFAVSGVPVNALPNLLSNSLLSSVQVSDSALNIEQLSTHSKITNIVVSGSIKVSTFLTFASLLLPVAISDTATQITENLSTFNTYYSNISSIQCSESLQFDGSILNYPNIVPLFTTFTLQDSYSVISSNSAVIINGKVKNVKLTDSVTVAQFTGLVSVPFSDVRILDSAVNVQSWLKTTPPSSILSIQTSETAIIPFPYISNAALLQTPFQVSNVPCANVAQVLAGQYVSSIYVVDTASQLSLFRTILDANRSKIVSETISDSNNVNMTVSEFLTYVAGTPSYSVVIVDDANAVKASISALQTNLNYIQSIFTANLTVEDITLYSLVVARITSFTVHDTATLIKNNLATLNNLPVSSILIDSGTLTLSVSQLLPVATVIQTFVLSDTSSNLQALAKQGFAPYTNCSVVVTTGAVPLLVSQVGAFVSRMSALSVVIEDVGTNITSFSALAPYAAQLTTSNISGPITIDYGAYNASIASKFTGFTVSNVPASQIASVLTSSNIYVTVSDTGEELSIVSRLTSSNIKSVTKTSGNVVVSVSDFTTYLYLFQNYNLTPIQISDTATNVASALFVLNRLAPFIQSVIVPNLSLSHRNVVACPSIISRLSPFSITDITCANIPSVLSYVNQLVVKDTLTNIMNDINGAGILAQNISLITSISVFKDLRTVITSTFFQQHKAIFNKFSFV